MSETVHPECWDKVMALIEQEIIRHVREHDPRLANGVRVLKQKMDVLRPVERARTALFARKTPEQIRAMPVGAIGLIDWAEHLKHRHNVETIGELVDIGWQAVYASPRIGRMTLWTFTEALASVGLKWPETKLKHPAKPCPRRDRTLAKQAKEEGLDIP